MDLGAGWRAGELVENAAPWVWTDDRLEELRRLWVEEALASNEVARRMGISRGTVMGKVNRLGLLRHRAELSLAQPSEAAETSQEPARPLTAPSAAAFNRLESHVSSCSGKHPTIFELRAGQCRFPLGGKNEPAEFFCAKPAAWPKPYCRECCQLAYVPTRPKR
jgi:GcrA cell cycle regulator